MLISQYSLEPLQYRNVYPPKLTNARPGGGTLPGKALYTRLLSVALLALLVMTCIPSGSGLEQSAEHQVTNTDPQEWYPRAAQDSEGNFHLLYYWNDGGDDQLFYRKVSPTGTTIGTPVRLSPTNSTALANAAIAIDPADRVHVTFGATYTTDDAGEVFYAQLSKAGALTVAVKRAFASPAASLNPDISVDAQGNACIVWTEGGVIYWTRLSSTGTVLQAAKQVSGTVGTGGSVSRARIGVANNGSSHVVWLQKQNAISRTNIFFTALGTTGEDYIAPRQVFSNLIYDSAQLEADYSPRNNELSVVYILNNEVRLLTLEVVDNGVISTEDQVAQAMLGQVSLPDVSVAFKNDIDASNDDIYMTYILRENLIPNTLWHAYLRVLYASNDSWEDSTIVGDQDLAATQPGVAVGTMDPGVFFMRDSDLFLVTFKMPVSPTNKAPVARLTTRPSGPQINQPVTFDGSTSSDPDSGDSVAGYSFAYGDGASSGWQTQSTITHTYTTAGTYIATLRVRDTHGTESSTAEVSVTVTGGTTTNKAPVAVLTMSPAKVGVGDDVLLDGTGSTDADGHVAQYFFNFGDGAPIGWTSSGQTIHAYASAGVFTATLQVKDDKGKVSENTASVQVEVEAENEPPTAHIVSIAPSPSLFGDAVTFTGEGTDPDGVISQYLWESNYEPVLSEQAVFTTSTLEVGIHTISFKVRDDDGVWSDAATATLEIKRNNSPVVESRTNRTKADTETVVEFLVRYTDVEGDYPTSAKLAYGRDGNYVYENLQEYDDTDKDVKDGKLYYFNTKLDKAGKWTFFFEFQNAKNAKVKSATGTIEVKEVSGFIPGPGAAMAALAMLAAVGTATIVARGSKTARTRGAG